jgi:UDP-N-acetylglucosamine 2-epimerase (non-hydrolysing)
VVVVVGDVNSTLACALVTAKLGAPLAHVEAGLRSRDRSMPEEINRVITDRVSDYLFAPSADAVANLRAEGYREEQMHLVGNVMVDTLLANAGRASARGTLTRLGLRPGQYGLVTLHRPANVDNPAVLGALWSALADISRHCPLVLPVHPRAAGQLRQAGHPAGVQVIPPAGYLDFIALEASARLVLTDSGGVQEETTVLGVPCLTLRDSTERPITLTEGTNRLVGRDPGRIVRAAREVMAAPPPAPCRPALWDGHAGRRIAGALVAGHRTRGGWPASLPDEKGIQVIVKDLIRPLPGVRQVSLLRQRMAFHGSAPYWERNYARGGTSGPGSYDALAEGKAAFLNDFVRVREVQSVIEFGCGDGHQLSLADYPGYIGLDVSRSAIELCKRRFADDPAKSFFLYDGASFADRAGLFTADLAISLDVIYHLTEDAVFQAYMTHLFAAGARFIIVYATNREIPGTAPHVRHRHFTPWVEAHGQGLRLLQVTLGPNPGPDRADFFIYERVTPPAPGREHPDPRKAARCCDRR